MIIKFNNFINENNIIKTYNDTRYETLDGKSYADIEKNNKTWHIIIIESNNKGDGTIILNNIIDDARNNNILNITLTAIDSSISFFEKFGFKKIYEDNNSNDIPMILNL